MSSRRGAGEENILAMLERDSARRTGPRMSGVRLASYGAAAALAGILAGGVAWLAYDNHQGAQELQAQYDAADTRVPPVMPEPVLPPPPAPAAAPANPVDVARTAVIVDESARKRDTVVASAAPSTVPPLVMLPPHELNGTKPAPAPKRAAAETQPAKAAKDEPAPAPTLAKSGAEKKAEKRAEKKAEMPAQKAEKPVEKAAKADKAAKPASRHAKATTTQARTKVADKAAAKTKPEATRARRTAPNAEAPVDSDVALISAIIQHSERHRGAREAAACSGPKCPPKAPRP